VLPDLSPKDHHSFLVFVLCFSTSTAIDLSESKPTSVLLNGLCKRLNSARTDTRRVSLEREQLVLLADDEPVCLMRDVGPLDARSAGR